MLGTCLILNKIGNFFSIFKFSLAMYESCSCYTSFPTLGLANIVFTLLILIGIYSVIILWF